MLNIESRDPTNIGLSITDVWLENISIDGGENATSDGAIKLRRRHHLTLNKVDVRRFHKAGAVAIRVHNDFSFAFTHSAVLFNLNGSGTGTGTEIGGSCEQATNVLAHDFHIQLNAFGVDNTTGITGGGLSLRNGAIRANAAATTVRCTGKFANLTFGPGPHVESETVVGSNTTTGFKFSGASLFASVVRFEGIDFYNIKTPVRP